ncbi:MAG TPA: NAD-dependent epimerase/dehydratase family protein [Terracidiphilus sp.]|nr:NAD-dependent epimerase/dehydratase family protein [Terracidiphilus sp.]
MSAQVLITGGAGFIGSHLADALLEAGHRVRILDALVQQVHDGRRPSYLSPDVELMIGDVRDPAAVRRALAGVEVIFHFAAAVGVGQSMYEISRYVGINTQGTAELLQGILDSKNTPKKVIVASSMSIYGEGQYLCARCEREVTPRVRSLEQLKRGAWEFRCFDCGEVLKPLPTREDKFSDTNSVYALSKRDQEQLCLMYGRTYGIPVTALRFFNIYGTRQALSNPYTGVAAVFASRLLNGQPPLIFEDGRQMRDFVSIHDIVRANMLAMHHSESDGEVINVGSGKAISVMRIAEILAKALGKDARPVVTQKYRTGDIRHCYADVTKARKLLGYEPQVTHEQGFSELAEWLEGQQAEDKAETMLNELVAYGLAV